MLLIPAIDILGGKVVRLREGKYDKKVYSADPVKTARHWVREGAKMLHLVDLDGAFTGQMRNFEVAKKIIRAVDIPIEFGGGVRDLKTIQEILKGGAARVVVGTRAAEDERFLIAAFRRFNGQVIVSIDTKDDWVFTHGWRKQEKKIKSVIFAERLKKIGLREIIYTDIGKDGTLKGPNIAGIKRMLKTNLKVIASGGVSSLSDIVKLRMLVKSGLTGIILGKALYEAQFTLAQATKVAR